MSPREIQTFEVSLKAFILRDGKALLVQEADTGFWELPGGRIDVGEERIAHDLILAREMLEELGSDLSIEATNAAHTFVRQRPTDGVFQFLMVRVCRHIGGDPALSDEHAAMKWVGSDEWRGLQFPPLSDYEVALRRLFELTRT